MAIGLDPANGALRYNHGIVKKNQKDHRGAVACYEAALAVHPGLRQVQRDTLP